MEVVHLLLQNHRLLNLCIRTLLRVAAFGPDRRMFLVELEWVFLTKRNIGKLARIAVVLLRKLVLLVLELQVGDVVVAYACVLIVLAVEHSAHARQFHDGEAVLHVEEVVVHALLVADQVSEDLVQLVDFEALIALLVGGDFSLGLGLENFSHLGVELSQWPDDTVGRVEDAKGCDDDGRNQDQNQDDVSRRELVEIKYLRLYSHCGSHDA